MNVRMPITSTSFVNSAIRRGSLSLRIRNANSWIISAPPIHTIAIRTCSAFQVAYHWPLQAAKATKTATKAADDAAVDGGAREGRPRSPRGPR